MRKGRRVFLRTLSLFLFISNWSTRDWNYHLSFHAPTFRIQYYLQLHQQSLAQQLPDTLDFCCFFMQYSLQYVPLQYSFNCSLDASSLFGCSHFPSAESYWLHQYKKVRSSLKKKLTLMFAFVCGSLPDFTVSNVWKLRFSLEMNK